MNISHGFSTCSSSSSRLYQPYQFRALCYIIECTSAANIAMLSTRRDTVMLSQVIKQYVDDPRQRLCRQLLVFLPPAPPPPLLALMAWTIAAIISKRVAMRSLSSSTPHDQASRPLATGSFPPAVGGIGRAVRRDTNLFLDCNYPPRRL